MLFTCKIISCTETLQIASTTMDTVTHRPVSSGWQVVAGEAGEEAGEKAEEEAGEEAGASIFCGIYIDKNHIWALLPFGGWPYKL